MIRATGFLQRGPCRFLGYEHSDVVFFTYRTSVHHPTIARSIEVHPVNRPCYILAVNRPSDYSEISFATVERVSVFVVY